MEVELPLQLDPAPTRVAKLKKVSEQARQREMLRYDPALSTDPSSHSHPFEKAESELTAAADPILTGLSQLGAYQTRTARAFISLFDQDYQYIIAETTPGLPLISNLKQQDVPGDKLWACGTAVRRSEGVCEHTLTAEYPEQFGDSLSNDADQLPFIFIRDLTADTRFSCKPYSRPGSPARLYAGVPIRTPKGVNIGVYCVIDSDVNKEWNPLKTQQMRTISRSIMGHLFARSKIPKQNRSIRMNRGLGSFMEGKATISGINYKPERTTVQEGHPEEGLLNSHQQELQQARDDELALHTPDMESSERWLTSPIRPSLTGRLSSSASGFGTGNLPTISEDKGRSETTKEIFSRASNIIRESIEVEGCVFFDAQLRSFGGLSGPADHRPREPQLSSSQGSSDDTSMSEAALPICDILGYSTSASSSIDGSSVADVPDAITQRVLHKLSRRYPRGKIFNFDQNGELLSSDSSEDDQTVLAVLGIKPDAFTPPPPPKRSTKPWARRREASTIIKLFPRARSVAFVPIWDSKKERWWAGTFVHTCTPTRTFTVEGELSFLRAFGMLAMTETAVLETVQSNKAKADVLGSISHELRSPLHGIVFAVELLHDSDLSAFQGNIVHMIETCSRTLTDTVDHLLDYSKINSFMGPNKPCRAPGDLPRGLREGRRASIEAGMKSLYADVWIDGLAEEVMESVFAGYNFQYAPAAYTRKQSPRAHLGDVRHGGKMDYMNAMEEFGPKYAGSRIGPLPEKVVLNLDIDPCCTWNFYTQPGAVRRIIMNLFGNSLKYTRKGSISIRLRQASSTRINRVSDRVVIITVADTGIGISQDYLQNHLFKPFQQEDQLSPGTGLGLSIVKKIATQLKGTISVESHPGVGTTISVSIPMVQVSLLSPGPTVPPMAEDDEFRRQVSELKGLRIRLIGLGGDHSESNWGTNYGTPHSVCQHWLQLEVIADKEHPLTSKTPDLLLVGEEAISQLGQPSSRDPPCVIVCRNATIAHQRALASTKSDDGGAVFEFISQPLGPRKIAKVVLIALKRWVNYQQAALITPPDSNTSASNLSSRSGLDSEEFVPPQSMGVAVAPSISPALSDNHQRMESGLPLTSGSTSEVESRKPFPRTTPQSHFLLVDDNHINLKILSTYVKKLGYTFDMAMNGQEALNTFKANPTKYSCIFMDISMPIMDGFEATRRIRAYERDHDMSHVLIFAFSGLASTEAQQEAFGSGINLFLSKPVTLKELESILEAEDLL